MPTLNWIGKQAVVKHHKEVPYRLLEPVPELSCGDPGSGNLIIQGDNLHALKALLPRYAGQVKCIYIDPPYNTGVDDRDETGKRTGWIYSDNVNSPEIAAWLGKVVGEEAEDLSRHDKWLCMMYPRLTLLKKFLRDDGVLFALEQLPRVAAAMATGSVSYSKVRAMTRVADTATEEYFLNVALHGTANQVEKLVRAFRSAKKSQELSREAQQHANRSLSWFHDEDGSLVIKARLPAEAGAVFLKALEAAEAAMPPPDVSAETSLEPVQSRTVRRADALALMAEGFLASDQQPLSGGDRQQIVVHVDAQTLKHDHAGRCELEDGPGIAAETARRLACDASLVVLVENEQGEPLNIGRKTRTIPPALSRALRSRDQGCRFPGCTQSQFVDGHHVQHWAQGGETSLSNLVSLCRFHHRLLHEGQVVVKVLDDGAFRFVRPNGRSFDSPAPGVPRQIDWMQMIAAHQARQIRITPHTAITRWQGERLDYELAVDGLVQRASRAENVSAETLRGD